MMYGGPGDGTKFFMPSNTLFNKDWLDRIDNTGEKCSRWLTEDREKSKFMCAVCERNDLSCKNGGWTDIKQHFNGKQHQQRMNEIFKSGQTKLLKTSVELSIDKNSSNKSRLLNHEEKVSRAETLWAMTVAPNGFSYNSNEYMSDIFKCMFPDSRIAQDFTMGSTKLSYAIAHETGKYFHDELVRDVGKAQAFTVIFDETTVPGVKKQLDIYLRYWSEQDHQIIVKYYKSVLLGHATGQIIADSIISSLKTDGLDIKKILMLGRDNPNVNKTVENLINNTIKAENNQTRQNNFNDKNECMGLLEIGTCPLHIVHNSFKNDMINVHWNIEEFLWFLWYWFSRSSARREDYMTTAESLTSIIGKFMIRFVNTRWIEISKVLERALEQWNVSHGYFLIYFPKFQQKTIEQNKRYTDIEGELEYNVTKIRLEFLLYVTKNLFYRYLTWFQSEGPLIHLLYGQCSELLKAEFLSFVKQEIIGNRTGKELLSIAYDLQANQLLDSPVQIGESTRKSLTKLSFEDRKTFFTDVRSFYYYLAKELIRTLPLKSFSVLFVWVVPYQVGESQ
ncbi:unnamed protein product [Didymodactylos carnosus]|uniref:Uncharacterized protein n=1 Tax=Didymodactylos carnosus TaxID=1234261 RepID=A0A815CHR9_9BILA|nr:unnamed protein product [Didymodactylos carnosus]CAF4085012.1 unnamed protein product [Didymodactylos carnosus]